MALRSGRRTTFRGFHVRDSKTHRELSEETEAFTCRIFHEETEIGFARNTGDGGPDLIQIFHPHRENWAAYVGYISGLPFELDAEGNPRVPMEPESKALSLLRAAFVLEGKLRRSKKYHSGVIAHTWAQWGGLPGYYTDVIELQSGAPSVVVDQLDPDLFLVLMIGCENSELLRTVPPPPPPPRNDPPPLPRDPLA